MPAVVLSLSGRQGLDAGTVSTTATHIVVWMLGQAGQSDAARQAGLPVVVAHSVLALEGTNVGHRGSASGVCAAPAAALLPLRVSAGAPAAMTSLGAAAAEQRGAAGGDLIARRRLLRRPEHLGLFFADADEPWGTGARPSAWVLTKSRKGREKG